MKHKLVIEIIAETYEEEQFLLNKFPSVWWDDRSGFTSFYVPESQKSEVVNVINEWKEMKKND